MQVMGNRETQYLKQLMIGNEYRIFATYSLNLWSYWWFQAPVLYCFPICFIEKGVPSNGTSISLFS